VGCESEGPEAHLRLRWFPLAELGVVDLRPSILRERLTALPQHVTFGTRNDGGTTGRHRISLASCRNAGLYACFLMNPPGNPKSSPRKEFGAFCWTRLHG
jgi:hypothetical protein